MEEANRIRSKLTGDFSVTKRPEPIAGDLRLGWGVSLLLLVLASSRGQRCSLQKIHFLAHLSRTAKSRQHMREVLARRRGPVDLSVRIEPGGESGSGVRRRQRTRPRSGRQGPGVVRRRQEGSGGDPEREAA